MTTDDPVADDPTLEADRALKARALRWLAQREHGRVELETKLQRWCQQQARPAPRRAATPTGRPPPPTRPHARTWSPEDAEAAGRRIPPLLDRLEARGLLSDARVASTLRDGKGAGWGIHRLQQALRRKGLDEDLVRQTVAEAAGSELARARDLWHRRFGEPASDPRAQARQARFLAARGFDAEVVRRVLREAAGPSGTGAGRGLPDDT